MHEHGWAGLLCTVAFGSAVCMHSLQRSRQIGQTRPASICFLVKLLPSKLAPALEAITVLCSELSCLLPLDFSKAAARLLLTTGFQVLWVSLTSAATLELHKMGAQNFFSRSCRGNSHLHPTHKIWAPRAQERALSSVGYPWPQHWWVCGSSSHRTVSAHSIPT